jgi:hypothetical protein
MPVSPYTITFQPSSSGTALVSRLIVSRPSGASGVHEGSHGSGSQDILVLGGPDMISSQGDNQHLVPRRHLHRG